MIKVIVFDYDLTLYSVNTNYHNIWNEYSEKMHSQIFANVSEDKLFNALKNNNVYPPHSIEKTADACIELFGTAKPLVDYLFANSFEQDYENMTYIDECTIKELSNIATLYIVSNAPSNNISRQLKEKANIDLQLFKAIYTNPHNTQKRDKGFILQKILKDENILPQELLMVGDNVITDLQPAKELGAKIYKVNDIADIQKLLDCLKCGKI